MTHLTRLWSSLIPVKFYIFWQNKRCISNSDERKSIMQIKVQTAVYLPQYPSGHFYLSSPWHMCPITCFSRTICSLSKCNVKCELDCFSYKARVFSDYSLQCLQKAFWQKKNQLFYGEYLTIIKEN